MWRESYLKTSRKWCELPLHLVCFEQISLEPPLWFSLHWELRREKRCEKFLIYLLEMEVSGKKKQKTGKCFFCTVRNCMLKVSNVGIKQVSLIFIHSSSQCRSVQRSRWDDNPIQCAVQKFMQNWMSQSLLGIVLIVDGDRAVFG